MRILTYTVTPEEDGRMVKGILRGSLQLSYTLLKSSNGAKTPFY